MRGVLERVYHEIYQRKITNLWERSKELSFDVPNYFIQWNGQTFLK